MLDYSFTDRAKQVAAYGSCVQRALPDVSRGSCQREFQDLRECFFKSYREAVRR